MVRHVLLTQGDGRPQQLEDMTTIEARTLALDGTAHSCFGNPGTTSLTAAEMIDDYLKARIPIVEHLSGSIQAVRLEPEQGGIKYQRDPKQPRSISFGARAPHKRLGGRACEGC